MFNLAISNLAASPSPGRRADDSGCGRPIALRRVRNS